MDHAPITIEQYLGFQSPDGYRDELIYGKIIVSPGPKPDHVDVAENIHELLKQTLGKKYRVAQRSNLRFPAEHSMPSPDVFVIEREAWKQALLHKTDPDGSSVRLVVEVLSPSNTKEVLRLKIDLYKKHSIEVWVIDPDRQEVKVYAAEQASRFTFKSDKSLPFGSESVELAQIKPSV
jgi:Uma2 family endonuclease